MSAQQDLLEFTLAIGEGFPNNPTRDRFGRTTGPRDLDRLRALAIKYKCPGAYDSEEQAGNVARAIIQALPVYRD